jgi:hypothetical protein
MSAMTFSHVVMAKAALQGAKDARRNGQPALAAQLAASARIHSNLCKQLALTTSVGDMNDVAAAQDAASQAEEFGPNFGGAVSGDVTGGRSWRSPGLGLSSARRTLDALHVEAQRRNRRGQTVSGFRALEVTW